MFVLISQSSRRVVEMIPFLSSQRNIGDVVKSARIFNTIEIMCLRQAQVSCNGRIGG